MRAKEHDRMITIKILGPGCANCRRLEELARKAAQELGVKAEVLKVSDAGSILKYDILSTPGLVINEKVVSSGRIPSLASIQGWVRDATH
jgi:small redox-active disulfide protein 2